MILKLVKFTYTRTSISNTTWTKLLPARDRDHLLIKRSTNDFQVYYKGNTDAVPSAATDGTPVDSNYQGDFWDGGAIPTTEVWVYQASGGALTIEAREGFASESTDQ